MSKISSFPEDVQTVARILSDDREDERSEIATKLTADSPELESMWKALEKRRKGNDDLWVWGFLDAATDAASVPQFHNLSVGDRRKLAGRIEKQCDLLANLLNENELDGNLVYCQGRLFHGFYLYEEFSENSRFSIDKEGLKKLSFSTFLRSLADHCIERLSNEPEKGKKGANAEAIR